LAQALEPLPRMPQNGTTEPGSPASKARKLMSLDPQAEHFVEACDVDQSVDNLRIKEIRAMCYPQLVLEEYPSTPTSVETVKKARKSAADIIQGRDDRLLVIVGPCSIHDTAAAKEYAARLKNECKAYAKDLCIIMRVYFEKPRTTVGWKGLINDPDLDGSFKVNKGLRLARELLLEINNMGVPCGCEFLDTLTPQYIADLVSWSAIGARTTECQLHRELASGLSMPVGFKNGTSGDCDIAIDAVISSKYPHTFFSTTKQGTVAIVHSGGNEDCQVVLRGGKDGPNYSPKHVATFLDQLEKKKVPTGLMIDCSHGNSNKDFKRQPLVVKDVCAQIAAGQRKIAGVMIESHLMEGAQKLPEGGDGCVLAQLRYGVSVTDGCINWTSTVDVLAELAKAVQARRSASVKSPARTPVK